MFLIRNKCVDKETVFFNSLTEIFEFTNLEGTTH